MRNVLFVIVLGILVGSAFAGGQAGVATTAGYVSADPLPVHNKLAAKTPGDGGPPGCDEIQYDDGHAHGSGHFTDKRVRSAVRMDPAYYPAIVAQCDICVSPDGHHDSIYVEIWFDQDGDSIPDFPAVWGAWAQVSEGTPDTAAITVPVPLGSVICNRGSFWVSMMMDTVHPEAGYEKLASDSVMDFPDHQVYYRPEQDTWRHMDIGGDWMIRSWTYSSPDTDVVGIVYLGRVEEGDSVFPRVTIMNLGNYTFNGWVWLRIQRTRSTGTYVDSGWMQLGSLEAKDTVFRLWVAGSRGLYRIQCTAKRNDAFWRYFPVFPRTGLEEGRLPQSFDLNGIEVGPNPVRSAATIRYYVASESRVELRILDTRGEVVRTLASGCLAPGEHVAVWDACDDLGHPAARGIYFVRLESRDCREARKVVLTQ
jgi:hypothetical protein